MNHTYIPKLVASAKEQFKNNRITSYFWRKFKGGDFLAVLEMPTSHDVVVEKIMVKGWAVSLVDKAVSGKVIINNRVIGDICVDKIRPDVFEVLQLNRTNKAVGFDETIDWDLHCSGNSSVEFTLALIHENDLCLFGPIKLSKSTSYVVHERGSYKQVWNSASITHQYAMNSVAGFSNFSAYMASGKSSAETFVRLMGIKPEDRVLEIGCGTGRVGASLAPLCKEWIGSDISGNMLKHARENLRHLSNVGFIELSGCNLKEIDNEAFDKIYCSAVFMHLDPWERYSYVKEAFRVLKKGGCLYVDNLNLAGESSWTIFEEIARLDAACRNPHISKHSTAIELETYLNRAGFANCQAYPGEHWVMAVGTKPVS